MGVARCLDDVRLRAGRILARPATGSEMAHLQMDGGWVTHDGRPSRRRLADHSVIRPHRLGRHGSKRVVDPGDSSPEHRVRNAGHLLGIPDVLMLTLAEYRIGIRPKGAQGTRRSARPL